MCIANCRTSTHEGISRGPYNGGPSRELVRQLLTRLSHPAREKDHLARRADISNDTAVRLPQPSLLFLSLSWLPSGPVPYPEILARSLLLPSTSV